MTLAIPSELKKQMDEVKFANWSEIARTAFKEKIIQFQVLESIAKKSKLTDKDALELGKKINKSMHESYKKEREKK